MATRIVNGERVTLTQEEEAARQIKSAAQGRNRAREQAIDRVRDYFADLVEGVYDDFTMDDLKVLQWIHTSTVPAARSDTLNLAAQRYVYARSKISEIRNMTTQEANNYDPVIDPGWPK